MNNTTGNYVPPKPQPKPEQTCPHCGYCPHCGRANAAPYYPYRFDLPIPTTPYYPTYPYYPAIVTTGATVGSTVGSSAPTVPPVAYKPSETFETTNRIVNGLSEAWSKYEQALASTASTAATDPNAT